MKLDLDCSVVFEKNYDAYRNPLIKIIANQGSARSTKTYSILQLLILDALEQQTESATEIIRKESSTLKDTAMQDFYDILNEHELYDEKFHNKSDMTYKLGKVIFQFKGLDQPKKKRGKKRRNLFINEANELTLEDWRQLLIRTTGKVFIDYNPSEEDHWIYDLVLTRDDCEYIHSTYKDNPFLEKSVVDEIERLKDEDLNFWTIFGLGEIGRRLERIYNNWRVCTPKEWEEAMKNINETSYGLDFGYNVHSALIEINEKENDIYLREVICETHLLNSDLIRKMNELNVDRSKCINADNAEPDKIEEILQAGFNIFPADKSVNDGIDCVQRKRLFIHPDSAKLIKEIKSYSWKTDKNGKILDEPVKSNDHCMDAIRYGLYTQAYNPKMAFV